MPPANKRPTTPPRRPSKWPKGGGQGGTGGGKGGKGSDKGSGKGVGGKLARGSVGKGSGKGSDKGSDKGVGGKASNDKGSDKGVGVATDEPHWQRMARTMANSRGAGDPTALFRGQMKRPWGGRVGHDTGYTCALSSAVAGRGSVGGTSAQLQLI